MAESNSRRILVNSTAAWRTLVLLVFGFLFTLGGWMLNEIYSLSDKFVSKTDYIATVQRLELKIDNQTEGMEDWFREVRTQLNEIRKDKK